MAGLIVYIKTNRTGIRVVLSIEISEMLKHVVCMNYVTATFVLRFPLG
jgi:uncharacterized protein YqgQ